ncbi:glucan biosynthesis protein [Algihabitans albus]|uniref:glucan biosynthesis protein n=1 Tax=Algihabitans albus TaxID=2164067 RepID=UPI000E5D71FA|nr:glucan biosynthesis protein [Algihabitans albus]
MDRRQFLVSALSLQLAAAAGGLVGGRASVAAPLAGDAVPFSVDALRAEARELAGQPARERPLIEGPLAELGYDAYRDIRYDRNEALWAGSGSRFTGEFFHPGFLYRRTVKIHEVVEGQARELRYDPSLFGFGPLVGDLGPLPQPLGFAGFRVLYPLNAPGVQDELAAFLGASYFRALGRGHRFGVSARGIAIDSFASEREEFPAFTSFWLERPAAGAGQVTLHALLEGESLTGAYSFVFRPGESTLCDVDAVVFPRREIAKLGVAPLTSMFLLAPHHRRTAEDFRPRVHDSDGLAILTGRGERIWRPLANPSQPRVSSFGDDSPRGFGLMQRTQTFDAYQDLEARYDLRPSLWVEPLDSWGPGFVELIELPTPDETYDNIVAAWVSAEPAAALTPLRLRYRLHWCWTAPVEPNLAEVAATWAGAAHQGQPDEGRGGPTRKFVIDFAGPQLADLPGDTAVDAVVQVQNGRVSPPIAKPNPPLGGWRAFFNLEPTGEGPVELRCFLRLGDQRLTETWSYQWTA